MTGQAGEEGVGYSQSKRDECSVGLSSGLGGDGEG